MERRLTAILSADVKGYSALVTDDDEATVVTLKTYRALMSNLIAQFHGHVVDSPGDNLLAEFASVVDAVRCALAMQGELHSRNLMLAESRRMLFRMGITVGDVVVDGGRLYGEGVNVAARVESLAAAGGICLSGNAYEQVVNRLDLDVEYLGEQHLKNIARPVAVWRIQAMHDARSPGQMTISDPAPKTQTATWSKRIGNPRFLLSFAAMVAVILIVIFATNAWPPHTTTDGVMRAGNDGMAAPLRLPDKPSIVVQPFANLSNDPTQDYLSDGITEDLTTDLAKLAGMFVISRSTAFSYKGKSIAAPDLGRELGVRYVLQGSVQKVGERLRISAQLLDTIGGQHLWVERYDRPAADIFAVQDEVRRKIVTALKVNLSADEQRRFQRAPTANLEAYDLYLQGQDVFARARIELKPELMGEARRLYEQAIALDADYAAAYLAIGLTHHMEYFYGWTAEPDFPVERVRQLTEHAFALDNSLPGVHARLGTIHQWTGAHEAAVAELELETALHPSDANAWNSLGLVLSFAGRGRDAARAYDHAVRLSPRYPGFWAGNMAIAYRSANRSADAYRVLKDGTLRSPNYLTNHLVLAALLGEDGYQAEARAEVAAILRISPNYTVADARKRFPFKDPALTEAYVDALKQAGLH
jgi:adenylate cyclase